MTKLRVAFAGHASWGKIADGPSVGGALEQAFSAILHATRGNSRLVLMSGYAPGADRLAVDVWQDAAGSHGATHIVLPFLPYTTNDIDNDTSGWCDDPGLARDGSRVRDLDRFDAFTVLDGKTAQEADPWRSAHLDQVRFLIGWSHVLVTVWDGQAPAGPGGTADAVRLAVSKGIPVLWIDARDGSGPYLIDPASFWPDWSFLELLEALDKARPEKLEVQALHGLLMSARRFPGAPDEAVGYANWQAALLGQAGLEQQTAVQRFSAQLAKRLGDRGLWRAYPKLKALLGRPDPGLQQELTPARPAAAPAPETATQPGRRQLVEAFEAADGLADRLATAHRSQQVILLVLAVTAVLVGVLAVPFKDLKLMLVALELAILGIVFVVWRVARGRYRHRRWSDTRAYAERLRATLATWALGFDVADDRAEPAGTWMEWDARRLLAEIGPPVGLLTVDRQAQDIRFAEECLLQGQLRYNRLNASAMGRFHHAVELLEESAFVILVLLLGGFLLLSAALGGLPPTVGSVITVASAVLPAVGAACIALDAKLGLDEESERSERLAASFAELSAGCEAAPRHVKLRYIRDSARLLTAETASWREAAVRRKLVRGG
ncbi:MAG: hypothetical protein MUF14_05635 [Hyphomonadaceae bacterium]|nr:hypothetical protein [Hyphomonadaceae bacterium]